MDTEKVWGDVQSTGQGVLDADVCRAPEGNARRMSLDEVDVLP